MPAEHVVLKAQPSYKNYHWSYLFILIVIAAGVLFWIYRAAIYEHTFIRKEYGRYVLIGLAVLVIIPVLRIMWRRAALVLKVFDDRVVIARGVLARSSKELFITDIRTIDINQTFFQRVLGVGELTISTPGVSKTKDVLRGMPDPGTIKDTIIRLRREKAQETKKEAPAEPKAEPTDKPEAQS